jgi:hypothetical protein
MFAKQMADVALHKYYFDLLSRSLADKDHSHILDEHSDRSSRKMKHYNQFELYHHLYVRDDASIMVSTVEHLSLSFVVEELYHEENSRAKLR